MVVVDASVAYKWWDQKEELSEDAQIFLKNHINKILVPDLMLYELANAWSTKTKLAISDVKSNLEDLEKLNLQIEPITFKLLTKAVDFSKKYNVSVYDASYAVLARAKKCDLVTADTKFVNQVNLPYVKSLADYKKVGKR